MDFKIRIEFDDGHYRIINVDDVIKIEAANDVPDENGWVLLDYDEDQISGYISPAEIRKVEYYKPDIIKRTALCVVALRAARRRGGEAK